MTDGNLPFIDKSAEDFLLNLSRLLLPLYGEKQAPGWLAKNAGQLGLQRKRKKDPDPSFDMS